MEENVLGMDTNVWDKDKIKKQKNVDYYPFFHSRA